MVVCDGTVWHWRYSKQDSVADPGFPIGGANLVEGENGYI